MSNLINGMLFPSFVKLDELDKFSLLPDDLFVVTYPKCGTTLAQQLVNLIQQGGMEARSMHLYDAVPWIEVIGKDAAMSLKHSPHSFKSHLPYHMMPGGDPDKSVAKYIYVARNPKDAAVSFYHHYLHFKQYNKYDQCKNWNGFFELFMKGEVEYGSWLDHVLEWWKHKDAANILFIKYEDLNSNLKGSVEKVAQFMGCSLDDAIIDKITEQCTFNSMKANPLANPDTYYSDIKQGSTPFLRKGVVGDWKNYFTDEQSLIVDDKYLKIVAENGLQF